MRVEQFRGHGGNGERFNEQLARQAAASLSDKFLATFLAMNKEDRDLCITKFNEFFNQLAPYHYKFNIIEIKRGI